MVCPFLLLCHILTSCCGPTWIAIRLKHCQPCCQVPQAEGAVFFTAQMAVLKLMASTPSWPKRRKVRSQSWASVLGQLKPWEK